MTISEFLALPKIQESLRKTGEQRWQCLCPAHADGRTKSLCIAVGNDGKILLDCKAGCKVDDVCRALGISLSDLFPAGASSTGRPCFRNRTKPKRSHSSIEEAGQNIARRIQREDSHPTRFSGHWVYHNADGSESLVALRFDYADGRPGEKPDKTFRPIHHNGQGYVEGDPPGLLPLYDLPRLDGGGIVTLHEGEKAVQGAQSIGLCATTSAHGADGVNKTDWRPLAGRDVAICIDNDEPGMNYGMKAGDKLLALDPPAKVRIVRLPGLPPKGDIVEFLEQRDAVEPEVIRAEILSLIENAEPIKAKPAEKDTDISAADHRTIQVVNAATWLDTEPPTADQIIRDTLDRGDKCCIVGSSKLRKSFLLLQMTLSLACGRPFLGRGTPKPRRILHVQFEIQAHHFQRRVRRMAKALGITPADLEDRLQVVNARGLGIVGIDGIKIIGEIAKPFSPDIICFDPLYKVSSGIENAAEGLKVILDAFDSLAEQTGASILFVHHDAKGFSGDRDIRDRGAGSNVLGRDYDACLTLTPHASEEGCVVVETLLRNYRPQDPFTIEWTEDMTTGGYCFMLRPDIPPTKRTSATSRQDTTPFDVYMPLALSLLKSGPMAIGEFKEKLRAKASLTYERFEAFKRWALTGAEPQLDVFESRGRGQHQKLIGTPEQIAKARAES